MRTTFDNSFPELSADSAFATSLGLGLRAIGHKFSTMFTAWHEIRARAASLEELYQLSDSELADIGLSRSAIPHLYRSRALRD